MVGFESRVAVKLHVEVVGEVLFEPDQERSSIRDFAFPVERANYVRLGLVHSLGFLPPELDYLVAPRFLLDLVTTLS